MAERHRNSILRLLRTADFLVMLFWLQTTCVGSESLHSQYWSEWSSWSPCSSPCEYGVSTRTRQCLQGHTTDQVLSVSRDNIILCNGTSSQVRICKLKACTPEEISPHQRSCSQYDSRTFSGKQYVWEPFIQSNEACKLSCRAKGVHFYANLADKAQDGTPCKLGTSEAICVRGVCKPVGCDGVVESGASSDMCGVCGGDSSSCRTISGIFTSTDLKRGLNYVITIPAGSTNINITELQTSRNLLVLQTETGKIFVNEDTNNPKSGTVKEAGTTFSHVAKSLSHPRETISSPGPTNMSVILKVLFRGGNPAIMYTFSAPKEVSETVIQQIRHHSQPIELPPDPVDSRLSQRGASASKEYTSLSDNHLTTKSIIVTSPSVTYKLQHFGDLFEVETSSHQRATTPDIIHEETTALSFTESVESDKELNNNFIIKDSDRSTKNAIANSPMGNQQEQYLSPALDSNNVDESQRVDDVSLSNNIDNLKHVNLTQGEEFSTTKSVIIPDIVQVNHQNETHDNDGNRSVDSKAAGSPDNSIDEDINKGFEHVKDERNESESSNSPPVVDNQIIDDQKIKASEESVPPQEDEISQKTAQAKISMASLSNGNSSNEKKLITQRPVTITTVKGYSVGPGLESYNADGVDEDSQNTYALSSESSFLGKNVLSPSKEHSLSKSINSNLSSMITPRTPHNTENDHSERNETSRSSNNLSRYKLPRYSQSFTFAERYKDNKSKSQSGKRSHRIRAREHARRRHHQQRNTTLSHDDQNSSQNIPRGTGDNYGSQSEYGRQHGKNTDQERGVPSGLNIIDQPSRNDGNSERGNTISEFGSSPYERNQQLTTSEGQQNNRDEQVSRDMRLRDRQALVEDRRRRMEEQRLRYNERLREYQEMLKQRHTELNNSRRKDSHVVDTTRSSELHAARDRNDHRNQYPARNSSSSIYSSVRSYQPDSRSSGVNTQTHTSQPEDIVRGNTGYTRRPPKKSGTSIELTERGEAAYPQTDTTSRSQILAQPKGHGNSGNDNSGATNTDFSSYDSDRQSIPETSFGRSHLPNIPIVKQPPRLEYPEYFDGDRTNSNPRNIPSAQPSGPTHLSGFASRPGIHQALSGTETQLGSSSNKLSHEAQSSFSRQPIAGSQSVSADTLPGLISLNGQETVHNTRGTVYEWRISGLTECTHSCGGGVQQTVVVCVDTLTQAVVTDDNCRHIPKPKILAVACNTRPCSAEWTPGPWSPCSVTCGKGEQTRIVSCQARVSPTLNLTMPSKSCENQDEIPTRQTCSNNPCSSWQVGSWSNCSTPCGDGKKTRDVRCMGLDKNIMSDDACVELRPDSEEHCNLGECGHGWFFTEWPTECPAECGTGEVTRQVFCADDSGIPLPESRCDVSRRPAISQICRASRPCGGLWFTGQWSKCLVKCGPGNRKRDILCIKELPGGVHAVVDKENCEILDKPTETEPCEAAPCTSEWYMTSWSQCSQSCGTGYRTREVKCLDTEQKPQDDCLVETRPKTRELCNTHNCAHVEAENTPEENQECTDTTAQCKVVKRARLCRYSYYKTLCCKSCAEDT